MKRMTVQIAVKSNLPHPFGKEIQQDGNGFSLFPETLSALPQENPDSNCL
jgi:hypothetical protein